MPTWVQQLLERPAIAHLVRAGQRYAGRLGPQFAAAVTYFSVLALVPLAMVGFAIVGFVLFVSRPDLIPEVAREISSALSGLDANTRQSIQTFVLERLQGWAAIGIIGLVAALYSGSGWMTNLRNAVDTQFRRDDSLVGPQKNILTQALSSLVYLLGLIVAIVVTFGFAAISVALSDQVISFLGLDQTPGLSLLFSLLPVVFSLAAGWLTFCYLYLVLPEHRPDRRLIARGALIGAVGLAALQYLTSFLITLFTSNKAVQLFGPVILLMLFFNLFAQLILFIAAWIATDNEPAFPEREPDVRFALTPAGGVDDGDADAEIGDADDRIPVLTGVSREDQVSTTAAVRSVRIGTGAGYVTGAATGVGIGAVIAFIAAWIGRRR